MRIQAMLLPASEDDYAFILIIDNAKPGVFTKGVTQYIAESVGARACLVFDDEVEVV